MITRHLAIACLIYLALVLQTGIARNCAPVELMPWLPGIVIVVCVLTTAGSAGLLWAGLLGLGLDCQSLDPLGVQLVVATMVASLLSWIKSDTRSHGLLALTIYVLVATFVWQMSTTIVHGLVDRQPWDGIQTMKLAGLRAGCTSAFAAVVLIAVRFLSSLFRPRQTSPMSLNNQWSMLTGK